MRSNSDRPLGWRLGGLLAVFAVSGASGLIYQSQWSHYLGLYLGHAAYAQALVLALFMGGMAAGAGWVARRGADWADWLRLYALCEGAIGLLGLFFPWAFAALIGFSENEVLPLLGGGAAARAWQWVSAALLVLPQTVLLGMTFPLMVGGLIRIRAAGSGRLLGGFYFTNSLGGAAGVLAATFLLLPLAGLSGTVQTAGGLNLAVMAATFWLLRGRPPALSAGDTAEPARTALAVPRTVRLVLIVAFLTGASSFVYELVWVRLLALAFGATLHAFELMLAAFILGLALGGAWIRRRLDAAPEPLVFAARAQGAMGLATLVSLAVYRYAFDTVAWMIANLAATGGGYALYNAGTALIAFVLLAPAAFFAGMTLPALTAALLRRGGGAADVGRVYAVNTAGAIAGVAVTLAILLPVLQLKFSLLLAAAVDLALGAILLAHITTARRRMLLPAGAALVAVLAAGTIPWPAAVLASGVFRSGQPRLAAGEEVLFNRDGRTASISVIRNLAGQVRIATNGKTDAGMNLGRAGPPAPDEYTMTLLGALPLLYHAAPRQVVVIGFGSGMTTDVLLADPGLERVTTIEIEPEMIAGARYFLPRNARAFDDPRSTIAIDDARAWLAAQRARPDLIISEPSNPWISGIGNLFSREFYRLAAARLADGGLFVQWLQLYEIDEALVGSVLRAMFDSFSDVKAYYGGDADLLLVAGRRPLGEPRMSFDGRPQLAAALRRLGIDEAADLAARRFAEREVLAWYAGRTGPQINTDQHPILTLKAPAARFRGANATTLRDLRFAELPVLEWLGVTRPAAVTVRLPADWEALPAARQAAWRARAVVAALRGEALQPAAGAAVFGPEPLLNTAVESQILALKLFGRTCTVGADEAGRLADALTALAMGTIVWLPADALDGAFNGPLWLGCTTVPEPLAPVLELISAVATRRTDAVPAAAIEVLAAAEARRETAALYREYAALALSGATLAGGDPAQALWFDETFGSREAGHPRRAELRRFIVELAALRLSGREPAVEVGSIR